MCVAALSENELMRDVCTVCVCDVCVAALSENDADYEDDDDDYDDDGRVIDLDDVSSGCRLFLCRSV